MRLSVDEKNKMARSELNILSETDASALSYLSCNEGGKKLEETTLSADAECGANSSERTLACSQRRHH